MPINVSNFEAIEEEIIHQLNKEENQSEMSEWLSENEIKLEIVI